MAFQYKYKQPGQNYNKIIIAGIVAVVIIAIYYFYQNYSVPIVVTTTTTTTIQTTTTIPMKADLAIAVKDEKQKLGGLGYATALDMTISSISIQNENGEWITVSNGKSLNLIEYTNNTAVVGKVELDGGSYKNIKLTLDSGTIKIYNYDVSIYNKTYPLNIMKKELTFNQSLVLEKGKTKIITLDFDLPKIIQVKDIISGIGIAYRFDASCIDCVKISEQSLDKGMLPANAIEI